MFSIKIINTNIKLLVMNIGVFVSPSHFYYPQDHLMPVQEVSTGTKDDPVNVINVDLFNIDSLIEGDVEEIVGNVTGTGYRWVWLLSSTSVEKAHQKAVGHIKYSASSVGCNAIIGLTTNVTYFPGFLGFRGCSVLLTGTAVRISYE
jgi:hypothetical protein